ncbi:MAG: fluoride efflux transporter CrcB [Verrucomicrobiales bacterium]|nr:fluoride efflux transporter CrcB [Verrucomicrobiales bacterium]
MKGILFIALGGSLGAVCRWALASWIERGMSTTFPLGIFTANILGCFLFGILFGLGETREWMSGVVPLFCFTGFLGSFTTFSTFSWINLELLKNGQFGMALLNIGLSIFLGLAGVWGGYVLATLPNR